MLNEKIVLPTILEAETKVKIADQVIKMIQDEARRFAGNIIDDLVNCESPIEQLMSAALSINSSEYLRELEANFNIFEIERQAELEYKDFLNGIKRYRTDFLIGLGDKNKNCHYFIVECDGYEFHSSKEKFELDRKRDRDLLSCGYITIRFSGKEIIENASYCASTVFKTIHEYMMKKHQF